jgi:hypothetical protein
MTASKRRKGKAMISLTVLKGGMLCYRYDCGPEISFDFNMLCEVGEPYQQWFRDEIARRGLIVEFSRDIQAKPWVADFVIKGSPHVESDVR